jgi:cysteinyl-tRNA synthetase
MRLYDSATGTVKPLAQREPGKVSFYACGPTVYDLPHVGHGRMALTYDLLRRYLESRGVEVHHVSNITDIEDKIINRAAERGVPVDEITTKYEAAWWDALDRMDVLRPHDAPHATAYVDQMISLIENLLGSGHAYETSDSIYFAATEVDGYGLLARQSIESLQAGARVEQDAEKRSPIDFALWKKVDPSTPHWDSPWGPGRPGWHTECVVMSLDLLGDGFDLHGGGLDLMFPHHENERAQAVAWNHPFARHWMHNGFVEVGGEKMSKSLGNFLTLTDLLDRTDPRAYRLLVLRSHYRSPIEVTPESIGDAETALGRLDDFARRFADVFSEGATGAGAGAGAGDAAAAAADAGVTAGDAAAGEAADGAEVDVTAAAAGDVESSLVDAFNERMDDDLDTPRAIAGLFDAVRQANSDADAGSQQLSVRKARAVFEMCRVLGLKLASSVEVDDTTAGLVRQRDEARSSRDWARADALRDELQALGWTVEDTADGTKVHR